MAQSTLVRIALLVLISVPGASVWAQGTPPVLTSTSAPPASAAHFELADVHSSPFANQPNTDVEYLSSGRFLARQATMVNLVAFAWKVEDNQVLRGPSWLDFDRFDLNARAPRGTSEDSFRLMLRALLADRFALTVHSDSKVMPAFVLTVAKGGPRMKPAKTEDDNAESHGCHSPPQPEGQPNQPAIRYNVLSCHGIPISELGDDLRNWAGSYITAPVVDQTGLKGSYDFEIKWTGRGQLARAGADGISMFDAVEKQLGLKLEARPAPLPVVFVDSVNEKPTPNPAGLDKTLTPPPAEFEVAILRHSAPDTPKGIQGEINGSQVNLHGATVQWFLTWAWDISDDMIADAPKWLNQDRWDLLAKLAHDPASADAKGNPQLTEDQLQAMIKKLVGERFGLQVHMEQRPADAYTLVAANPHLKKADPDNRTGCHEGPGPDGKDPRVSNPILNRLLTCQNMTMAQFGDVMRVQVNGYIHSPVLDQTGLPGAYDFTLSFSGMGQLQNNPAPKDSDNSGSAADPNGAISFFDAIQKQMGVKLIKQKRPVQMLVIDAVNQTPTDN